MLVYGLGRFKKTFDFHFIKTNSFWDKRPGERGSKGKGGRAAEVRKTRLETGVKSQHWAMRGNALLKPDPAARWPPVRSESAGVSVQCCVPVNTRGSVCVFVARTFPYTCRRVCRGKGGHGDLGRVQRARVRRVHERR